MGRQKLNGALSRIKQLAWKQRSRWHYRSLIKQTGSRFDSPPQKGATTPTEPRRITAACILDDFTYDAFKGELNLVPIKLDSWPEAFKEPIDMLFVEAAWRGSGGSWRGLAYDYNVKERETLKRIVRWCRKANIPTVFWNKEDPVHYDEFIDLAVEFDFVFTTDSGCIGQYAERGKKAEVLRFAAQPSINNPIEAYPERLNKVCFAGSYIRLYPQRMKDFEAIVDAIGLENVDIYDRNLERGDPRYAFPKKYASQIKGTLKGGEIVKAYKGYRFGLNMNSVKSSETMLARRVFELMASNTPVISNSSVAIEKTFPGLALASDDPEVIRKGYEALRTDRTEYRKRRLQAMREVMLHHTYRDRAEQIHRAVFGGEERSKLRPVLCATYGRDDSVEKMFDKQVYANKKLAAFQDAGELANLVRYAAEQGMLITVLDKRDHYGPHYLEDMALAFFYSDAQAVTKLSLYSGWERLFNDGHQYRWVQEFSRAVMIDPTGQDSEAVANLLAGKRRSTSMRILAIDEFNYVEALPRTDDVPYSDV